MRHGNKFLLVKSPSLWRFVTSALADYYKAFAFKVAAEIAYVLSPDAELWQIQSTSLRSGPMWGLPSLSASK